MWRTLYVIGLALPRIVFRPWREFQVIIPGKGIPFIEEKQVDVDEFSHLHIPIQEVRSSATHKHPSASSPPMKESDQKESNYRADRRDEE